ncbi:MAG TPA: hypothetical protein VHE13_17650 [Opitutus sp.]|nr:hypothetical protein [Opitutus sp.]
MKIRAMIIRFLVRITTLDRGTSGGPPAVLPDSQDGRDTNRNDAGFLPV